MPASSRLPLAAVVLLLPAATTLLFLCFCPAAAAATSDSRVVAAAGAAPDSEWRRRRLEDEVAPELGGMLALGANQGHITYNTLNKNRPSCGGGCAARGASYTNKCTYKNRCRG